MYKNVPLKSLFASGDVKIRPLTLDEIHHVVLLARKSGWYGNITIANYLVEKGALDEDGQTLDSKIIDIFTCFILAKEVWIATLDDFARDVNSLISLINQDRDKKKQFKKIKVNRYRFSDLGTPGLYWSIQKDMDHIDVDQYVNKVINYMVPKVKNGKKTLGGKAKEQYLEERWEEICNWLLKKNCIDDGFSKTLPIKVFSSPLKRFYAILKISETLDWIQYFRIVYWYNKCVEVLNLKSNKLGGLDVAQPVLITGIPSFATILDYSNKLPKNVLIAVLSDLMSRKRIMISKYYGGMLNRFYHEAMNEVASKGSELKNKNKAEIALEVLNRVTQKTMIKKSLVRTLCYIYWEQFSESITGHIAQNYYKFLEENALTNIPDCYILVEGVCEDIFFKKVWYLLDKRRINIKIIDCESKYGVYSKYRDIINNEPYIGCVLTVLDSDAKKEHEMIEKLKCKSVYTAHFIYQKGSFEDLFTIETHVKTINDLYQLGEDAIKNDFVVDVPLEKQLRRIIWNKKTSAFDKTSYARAISKQINSLDEVPLVIRDIFDKALELSNNRLKNRPKAYSLYSIAALASSMGL